MQFIDTHCHIHSADYPLQLADVEARADQAGVTRRICVGTDAADSELAVQFALNRPSTWASIGLHPHEAKEGEMALSKLQLLLNTTQKQKIIAIGECGLDYFYSHSSKGDQEKALRFQIELALRQDLPLIFHVRDAFDDFWPIFDSYPDLRGVIHSFTDNEENIAKALQRNLYIGINGIMTFTKNDWQLQIIKQLPLENIVLETDAPFLTPVPLRGKVNEPAHVRLVAQFLANQRGEPLERIANVTTHNARRLFII